MRDCHKGLCNTFINQISSKYRSNKIRILSLNKIQVVRRRKRKAIALNTIPQYTILSITTVGITSTTSDLPTTNNDPTPLPPPPSSTTNRIKAKMMTYSLKAYNHFSLITFLRIMTLSAK